MTVDASDLDNLKLAADVQNNGIAGTSIALNGSGLGIAVGSSSFGQGGFKSLDVINGADPTNTGNFLSRINLPGIQTAIALAKGRAFGADGGAGLQIVNYLSFDTKGVPPIVAINVS